MTPGSFEVIAGAPDSKVILHVPHSSRFIPDDVRKDLLLSDEQLATELDEITDTFTDLIALETVKKLPPVLPKPWIFVNRMSRTVIDPERFPDEREIMNKVGLGAVYKKTSSGAQLRSNDFDPNQLLEKYFHPYATAFTELTRGRVNEVGQVVIIDVHSYRANQHPNAVNHGQKRPAMCIGTDTFHTPIWLTELFHKEFGALGDCFENEPYAGTYVPLEFYQKDKRVSSIMMETRANTFLDENLRIHNGFEDITSALKNIIMSIQNVG